MKLNKTHTFLLQILTIAFLFVIQGCAKIVTPVGGPRDVTPPKVLKMTPPNQSKNFDAKTIKLAFDEYFVLNNPLENVIFSPPLGETPEFIVRGKSLHIRLKDSLAANTTYTINFTNSIKDYREGNLLPFFQYTFSTGSYIDSFFVEGDIYDAQTLQPVSDCFVFLYKENVDSLPLTSRPDYLVRPDEKGHFLFPHLSPNEYKVFALQDKNQNFIYDLTDERVAFCDEVVKALPTPSPKGNDSSKTKISPIDSSKLNDETIEANLLKLVLFKALDSNSLRAKLLSSDKLSSQILFSPISPFVAANFIDTSLKIEYLQQINRGGDTLTIFFKEPLKDTLKIEVLSQSDRCDTLSLPPYEEPFVFIRSSKPKETAKLSVKFINGEHVYKPLTLIFNQPVKLEEASHFTLISKKRSGNDTLIMPLPVSDDWVRELPLRFKKEEKVSYSLIIKDSTFLSFSNNTNDSIFHNFTVKSEKDYGDLIINYRLPREGISYIVMLLSSKDKIIQTDYINSSTRISYENLIPDQYKIKVVEDSNSNQQWDSGDYHRKIQPEKIFYFPKPLSIRGYWELEESFQIPEE